MSQRSLLLATKKFLIDHLTWNEQPLDENHVDITLDGRPPSIMGDLFICVHPGSFRNRASEFIEAVHSLNITINRRITHAGFDRFGPEFLAAEGDDCVDELAQQIVQIMHLNYELINYANTLIDPNLNRWTEPLRFENCPPPRIVGGDWFHADANSKEEGIVQPITFNNAVRCQWAQYTDPVNQYFQPLVSPPELEP